MTESEPRIPSALASGIRALRSVPDCEVRDEAYFDTIASLWVLPLSLTISNPSEYVPARTNWHVLIDEYPWGKVSFYPSEDGGIESIFPHQDQNPLPYDSRGWKAAKLCLDSPFAGERFSTMARDPAGDIDERLRWHVQRALDWLLAAASDRLQEAGDPFELPFRRTMPWSESKPRFRLVTDETPDSFELWSSQFGRFGRSRFGNIPGIHHALAVQSFLSNEGHVIREWTGRSLVSTENRGIWWLWHRPIIIPPWRSPDTWGMLRAIGKLQGIDVDSVLQRVAREVRGIPTDSVLLLGYPISRVVGQPAEEIHWDAVLLPHLDAAEGQPKGFRPNEIGWWNRDRTQHFGDTRRMGNVRIENWAPKRLRARGTLPDTVTRSSIALIGAGGLGSQIAEMLVRTGVANIALFDGDRVESGNVCRHSATLNDIDEHKVTIVAQRLKAISPHVNVSTADNIAGPQREIEDALEPFDIIIDCTASDDLLAHLQRGWWPVPRLFFSCSLGYAASRLYLFSAVDHSFPLETFKSSFAPLRICEDEEWNSSGEVLEGAGCWSPLFPARFDFIVQAAAICVAELERLASNRPAQPVFDVFSRNEDPQSGWVGFKRIDAVDSNLVVT